MAENNSKRLVFLCSGGGGNLAFTHMAITKGLLARANIVSVITDRLCQANEFSDRARIPNRVMDFSSEGQLNLLNELDNIKPDLVITTVHKIIRQTVVESYHERLINLHYSLLPAFSGLIGTGPVRAALEHGVLFGGVTVHQVNKCVDSGRPLVQGVIALQSDELLENLMPVVFRSGCIALLSALTKFWDSSDSYCSPISVDIIGRRCQFNGGGAIPASLGNDEEFWRQVQKSLGVDY